MALHEESRERVKIAAILSMSKDEIEEALKVVNIKTLLSFIALGR